MTESRKDKAIRLKRETLTAAVDQLRSSEGWQQWLAARKKFHTYSFRNQLIIAVCRAGATKVRGRGQWKTDFNRYIKEDDNQPIWILAPITYRDKRDLDDKGQPKKKTGFKSVPVFDVSQTEQIPGEPIIPLDPPVVPQPLTGDSHEHLRGPLHGLAEKLNFPVEYSKEPKLHNAHGFCDFAKKRIVIDEDLAVNQQMRTLIHEIAHALDIRSKDLGRDVAEAMTDAAAWIAADALDLDVSQESVPYIAIFSDMPEKPLVEHAGQIDKVAKSIVKYVNEAVPDPEENTPVAV